VLDIGGKDGVWDGLLVGFVQSCQIPTIYMDTFVALGGPYSEEGLSACLLSHMG
jgi:hypothetical protein